MGVREDKTCTSIVRVQAGTESFVGSQRGQGVHFNSQGASRLRELCWESGRTRRTLQQSGYKLALRALLGVREDKTGTSTVKAGRQGFVGIREDKTYT